MSQEIQGYDSWKTEEPMSVREVTEQEACDWFNNQTEDDQNNMISYYPEYERLLDDEASEWWKVINTNSIDFGNFVLNYFHDEVYSDLRRKQYA